jgi:hypothetical protein
LLGISINYDALASKSLNYEVTNYATISRGHARTVGVEDSSSTYIYIVLAVVVEK